MERRLGEFVPAVKQILDEPFDPTISIAVLRPIIDGEHRRYRNGIDSLARRYQVWIIRVGELTYGIEVGESLGIRHRQEMKAGVRRYFQPEVDRLGHRPEETSDFTRQNHFVAGGKLDEDRLDRKFETLEDDRAGQRRRSSRRTEHDFLAAQVFEGLDVRSHQNVELGDRKTDDVADPVLQMRRLALRTEIFEDIRLGERDVDAAKVEQVIQVGGGATCYDGKHAQLVAVVEHFSELVGPAQVGAVHEAAGDADRPVVLALFEHLLRPALLKGFRNGLA